MILAKWVLNISIDIVIVCIILMVLIFVCYCMYYTNGAYFCMFQ